MFLWKCLRFRDSKCLELRGTQTPPAFRFMLNALTRAIRVSELFSSAVITWAILNLSCLHVCLVLVMQPWRIRVHKWQESSSIWQYKEDKTKHDIPYFTHWPLGDLNDILNAVFKLILGIDGWGISCIITFRQMSLDLTDKSTLVPVMAWCRQATSHYLNQCWPCSMLPYGITRPQWVKEYIVLSQDIHVK